jgi:acyl-[acyl carrier protein]--UDP-N-acetylglucosamine O-acyltransferase
MKPLDKLRSIYLTWYLRFKGARVGVNLQVLGRVEILLRDKASLSNLSIGDDVVLGGRVFIRMRANGKIVLQKGVRTGTEVWLVAANNETFVVGDNSILGSYSIFNGGHGLQIGTNCIFAAFVYVNTSDHKFRKNELINNQGFFGAPIEIGDDVWLGGHVFINKGVRIGHGAVIGAGSIVTRDIPGYSIAAGNPARLIGERE